MAVLRFLSLTAVTSLVALSSCAEPPGLLPLEDSSPAADATDGGGTDAGSDDATAEAAVETSVDSGFDALTPTPIVDDGVVSWSGTRLRVVAYKTKDGARIPRWFHDNVSGVSCAFALATDGTYRCLPTSAAYQSSTLFADASCTTLAVSSSSTTKPRFAQGDVESTCSTGSTPYYEVGDVATAVYRKSGDGSCSPATKSPGSTYYATGALVPPSSFVGFAEKRKVLTSTLEALTWQGDDGSRWFNGRLYDTARGSYCRPTAASDGTVRCMPIDTPTGSHRLYLYAFNFADATCSTLGAEFDSCSATDRYLWNRGSPTCTPGFDFSYVGQVHAAGAVSKLHTRSGGECKPSTTGKDVISAASVIDPSSLPELTATTYGGSRLRAGAWQVGTYAVPVETLTSTPEPYVVDAARGFVRCNFRWLSDGKFRCVPRGADVFFADATCTKRWAKGDDDSTTTCKVKPTFGLQSDLTTNRYRVYAIGEATKLSSSESPHWITSDGTCRPRGGTSHEPAYTVLGEVAATEFPEAEWITE